ncbi:hypothetical protein [Litoribaculum gwangyangense]|uniref:Uncharacterized protein n=1 Tax=Litoribaculum gwangyangense TaxID=1130722 RepID=A0ABP9CQP4_9FLAO
MNENANKYLDDLSKKVMAHGKVESPSFNFTDAVMSKIETLSKNQATIYKPLISKRMWFLILVGFLALFSYGLFSGNNEESIGWLNKIDFSILSNNNISNTLSSFKFSKTLMYALVFFGSMICLQIPILKHYFNKRLEY